VSTGSFLTAYQQN